MNDKKDKSHGIFSAANSTSAMRQQLCVKGREDRALGDGAIGGGDQAQHVASSTQQALSGAIFS